MQLGAARGEGTPLIKFSAAMVGVWLAGFLPLESGPIWITGAAPHFHASPVTIGMIASAQFLVAAITAMFIAPRLSRWRLRYPLLATMAVILTVDAISAFGNPSLAVFAALRVIDGACGGVCIAGTAMLISLTAHPARYFGVLQFSQIIGNMVIFALSVHFTAVYGLAGLYGLLGAGTVLMLIFVVISKPWPLIGQGHPHAAGPLPKLPVGRIAIASLGLALVYCAFIGVVTNAAALGLRAGLDVQGVTKVLAISTLGSASGAITATVLAGRASGRLMVAVSLAGAIVFGLVLMLFATSFATLLFGITGLIYFMYIGMPTMMAGVSRLDLSGRAAAAGQAGQLFGPVFGAFIGAVIAAHSVPLLMLVSTLMMGFGIIFAVIGIWPSLGHTLRETEHEVEAAAEAA